MTVPRGRAWQWFFAYGRLIHTLAMNRICLTFLIQAGAISVVQIIACTLALVASLPAQSQLPLIPRAWDDAEVARFELPLATPDKSPRYLSAEEYYKYSVRPIYRGYPVYLPGKEPEGYIESLKKRDPEIVFDPAKLNTESDWIRAGEFVFEAPLRFRPLDSPDALALRDPQYYKDLKLKLTRNGIYPYAQYVVRRKGVVELGYASCANCHIRVLDDGSIVKGAQGDFPFYSRPAWLSRNRKLTVDDDLRARSTEFLLFGAPWISPFEALKSLTAVEVNSLRLRYPPGVMPRQGTSASHPTRVPSLIGVKDIRYFDATGLGRHRSIGDLMRYAIVNSGMDIMARFGDFQPAPDQGFIAEPNTRYSDEQLYALSKYLYSLQPPPNPNRPTSETRQGQRIFQSEGCAGCHPAPLYTSNKLTPALGFVVPQSARESDEILAVSVGTDHTLAMKTRRGTGYYKVPSLRGVWYRNGFGHEGAAWTLEEWLDPTRLNPGYIARGFQAAPGPIQGHEFGLTLNPEEKKALIAFLLTL